MLDVVISILVTLFVVSRVSTGFSRHSDVLMVSACRNYNRNRERSEEIIDYVSSVRRLSPYIMLVVGFSTFVLVYELLCFL